MIIRQYAAIETEQVNNRPKCGWPVPADPNPAKNGGTKACGSEERLYSVKGHGRWGYAKETPVCEKHLPEAWKKWNVDSAEPLCGSPRKSSADCPLSSNA